MRSRINQTANRIETKRMRIEGGPRGRRIGHSRAAARNHGKRSETASKCSEMNGSGRWKRTAGGRNVSRMSTGNGRCSNRSVFQERQQELNRSEEHTSELQSR